MLDHVRPVLGHVRSNLCLLDRTFCLLWTYSDNLEFVFFILILGGGHYKNFLITPRWCVPLWNSMNMIGGGPIALCNPYSLDSYLFSQVLQMRWTMPPAFRWSWGQRGPSRDCWFTMCGPFLSLSWLYVVSIWGDAIFIVARITHQPRTTPHLDRAVV